MCVYVSVCVLKRERERSYTTTNFYMALGRIEGPAVRSILSSWVNVSHSVSLCPIDTLFLFVYDKDQQL